MSKENETRLGCLQLNSQKGHGEAVTAPSPLQLMQPGEPETKPDPP